eukprot:1898540-Prymnesium_polylepis.1
MVLARGVARSPMRVGAPHHRRSGFSSSRCLPRRATARPRRRRPPHARRSARRASGSPRSQSCTPASSRASRRCRPERRADQD